MKEKTMHYLRLSLALGLAGLTAACGQKVETPVSSETTGSIEMAMAPAAATPILAKGHGTVTAIDKGAGTITLAHGPIPEAKWPDRKSGGEGKSGSVRGDTGVAQGLKKKKKRQ